MLTFDKKLESIKSNDAGSSYTVIVEKYSACTARLMVANIKKDVSNVKTIKKSMEMG